MAKAWINGHVLENDDNVVSIFDRGFTLADGAFETMYFDTGIVEYFQYHTLRLRNALSTLAIPHHIDDESLLNAIVKTADMNGYKTCAVRVTVTRGVGGRGLALPQEQLPTMTITVSTVERNRPPARMGVSEYTRNDTSPLSSLKTLSYTDGVMALEDVSQRGFDEALILNTKGRVCCASAGNIFFVLGNNLVTPDLAQGCLAGITRSIVIQSAKRMGISVQERAVSIDDIKNADAVFITNSIMKIRLVATLEQTYYALDNAIINDIKSNL